MTEPIDPRCELCGLRAQSDCTCSRLHGPEQGREERLTRAEIERRNAHHALSPLFLVDSREQTPWRFSEGVRIERVTLPAGDYSVAGLTDRVAIERKSLPDLVGCVGPERPRFLDCCERLQSYEYRCLIVEASVCDVLAGAYRSRTNPQSVIGTTIALMADYRLPVLWAGNAQTAANLAERLLMRLWRRHVQEAIRP